MSGSTDFLYPMIDGDAVDVDRLLTDLSRSAAAKAETSAALTAETLAAVEDHLGVVAAAVADRLDAGGCVFTFGNGGSATDAEGVAALFTHPPAGVRSLPARSLVADVSILTALANDIGFDAVFARQLIAHAGPDDVAIGFSTSGNSTNVVRGFEEAHARGVLTIGVAGNDGGAFAHCDELDHLVVVDSQSVHRIQEAQSAVAHELWRRVHETLGTSGAPIRTGSSS